MEEGAEVEGVPLGGRRIDAMPQLSLFQKAKATPAERELTPVEATLSELDLESMTPLEALNALAELVTMVAEPSTKN
jgi:hypothetical protein